LLVADAHAAGGTEELLEARAAHEIALFLCGEHVPRFGEQRPDLPRWNDRTDVDVDLDGRGASCSCIAPSSRARAMRGSGPSTVAGGGHGADASHRRSDRAFGSAASRNDNAVEPVRGRPNPINGASIGSPSISG
jgi:hypothetical protein